MRKYGDALAQGRFVVLHAAMLIALATLFAPGPWPWLGGAFFIGIAVCADVTGEPYLEHVRRPVRVFLEGLTLTTPPLVGLLLAGLLMRVAGPDTPAAAAAAWFGLAPASDWLGTVGAIFSNGVLAGVAAVTFAHELIHRRGRLAWLAGQFVLARCLNPAVAIEHTLGHHVHVGTPEDRATAPRGMSFWRFVPASTAGAFRGAARREAQRLRRHGRRVLSLHNRFIEGLLVTALLLLLALLVGGLPGLAALIASGLIALLVIEQTNYVLHYGLVRAPGRPVLPRHSWNAPRFFAASAMINGQRHSHHHAAPRTPYWDLRMINGAAVLPWSTGLMSIIALVPPLWFRMMQPHLDAWDCTLASPEEIAILRRQPMPPPEPSPGPGASA